MGKVKLTEDELEKVEMALYQFPMGKVKNIYYTVDREGFAEYQFPMGKVKLYAAQEQPDLQLYQFPMGKVKICKLLHLKLKLANCINSLWER